MNSNLNFIKLCKNAKIPIKNENFKDATTAKPLNTINTKLYNVGLCCAFNNLLILDIDIKDDGLTEWNEYLKDNEDPQTVCQKTASGGYHYIFNYENDTYTDEETNLINCLKNKSKYRAKGLDIRKNNGYIVCEPSIINGSKYEFIRHYNNTKILNIPLSLLKWLLEFENIYNMSDDISDELIIVKDIKHIVKILNKLDSSKTKIWINATNALKCLQHQYNNFTESDILAIWDNWGATASNYNKENNIKIWNSIRLTINFNCVICQYNLTTDDKIKLFETIKDYKPITKDISHIKKVDMCNNYIYDEGYKGDQLTEAIFNDNDTIIIKSTTGTGKTSNIAKFINKYMELKANGEEVEKFKILSIVSRRTLAAQHIESFEKENIEIISYKDNGLSLEDDNITICINSLLKYSKYKPAFFKNYIVYIDEVATFMRHLTHNNTLDHILKLVYITLMKIINNCHKIIVSESLINDNVFNILEKRDHTKKIFIDNTFLKYDGIPATKHNDENKFFSLVLSKVEEKQYFLFGCDSNDIITKYFIECSKIDPDNCILITADTNFELDNANEQFKNKYVFYSPSITCGVDFNISEAQDVFIYINGKTLEPCDSFQQLTRTRNIKNVYYFIRADKKNDAITHKPNYKNINECESHYIKIAFDHSKLSSMCQTITEEDEIIYNKNTFFKLYTYNEYINDIYNSNKQKHFEQILKNNGFILNEVNSTKILIKATKQQMKNDKVEHVEKIFNDHIEEININDNLSETINFLKIETDEDKIKYATVINDKYVKESYLNLIALFYTDDQIKLKLRQTNINTVEYKAAYSKYNKISLIRQMETEMNIKPLDTTKLKINIPFAFSDVLLIKLNTSFRTEQTPTTFNECIEYYINRLKNLTQNINFIDSVKKQVNKVRCIHYNINKESLKYYFELHYLSNPTRHNMNINLLERFKDVIKVDEESDVIFEPSEIYNNAPDVISLLDQ